jgi:hypothetical protein
MIYRDHFFDTMERVRTAKEEMHYFPKESKYEHNDKRQRKVYMCTQSSNYSPSSIPSLLDGKSIA